MPRSIVYTAHGLPRILHGSRCPAQGSTFVPRTEVQYEPVGVSYCDVCLSVTHPSASGERGNRGSSEDVDGGGEARGRDEGAG